MVGLRTVAVALILAPASFAVAQSEIADAAMRRDNDAVRSLLQDGFAVDAPQSDGEAVLQQ